jgi:flavin-dependent dehydrogenase
MVYLMLELFQRPYRDQLLYLSKLGINLRPLNKISRVIMHSPRRSAAVRGNLGFLVERGQGEKALEVQLAEKLHTRINFNVDANYRDLAGDYEFVVVADGSSRAAAEKKYGKPPCDAWVKGAVILGEFNPEEAAIFFDTSYARHGYAFLAPFDRDRAVVMLSVPDIKRPELDGFWEKFLQKTNLDLQIVQTFEINHTSGVSSRQRIENILLAGNAGGFTDSLLGLGLVMGITSGVLAGRAISDGLDYERMVRPMVRRIKRLIVFREALNRLDNDGISTLISAITLPGV